MEHPYFYSVPVGVNARIAVGTYSRKGLTICRQHTLKLLRVVRRTLPLKPDEVNAKSRKTSVEVQKCGNEWKSVVNARVKGTVCPVCAEREVLAGYNDLATTDSQASR
ncbi:zinc-ribbon domain-containing protein [[Ruminococcus] lactaris]|uniref:zinc-ribbon domain-containing protein n=1 Tax=[Ruminococcus] lactaris TaxID=46228 RepID=UPI002FE6E078